MTARYYIKEECCLFPKGLVLGLKEVHRAVMGKIEGHVREDQAGWRAGIGTGVAIAVAGVVVLSLLAASRPGSRPARKNRKRMATLLRRCRIAAAIHSSSHTTFLTTTLNDGRFCYT